MSDEDLSYSGRDHGTGPQSKWRGVRVQSRERGAIAVMAVGALIVICGLLGLGLDLSRVYNRRVELQNIADAAALAAAHELNGTTQGINNAVTKAGDAARRAKYNYWSRADWSNAAIKFSSALEGEWLDAGAAAGKPSGLKFVRVDTSALGPELGTVETIFIQVVGGPSTMGSTAGRATAGPSSINAVPFGICAMSSLAAEARTNPGSATPTPVPANVELVQYGFRRGVGYDLMQLNPGPATSSGLNFVISPINGNMDDATVGAFVCTGTMASREIVGKTVKVASPFPMAALFNHFNSRFDMYPAGACSPNSAPPDANIKAYDYSVPAKVPWTSPTPTSQAAQTTTLGGKRWTIADLQPDEIPTNMQPECYGVLWSYAKAIPFASYTGSPEPAAGYMPFAPSAWSTLYDPGRPAPVSYPSGTPYAATSGTNFLAPSNAKPGLRGRRVLNIPLLACPVSGGKATVLAIGKFFMPVPATATSLYGEFAGIESGDALSTDVELYP